MSSARVFLVVLFLIGILFVVGINLGASHSDEQTFQTPGWVNGLGKSLANPQPLKIADLSTTSANCIEPGRIVVPMGQTCTFAIKQSSFTLRVVMLQLVQGASATVTLSQEETLPVQQSLMNTALTTNADMKVYPGKTHGTLDITCLDGGNTKTCLLKLV
jgi:hypothetical protein